MPQSRRHFLSTAAGTIATLAPSTALGYAANETLNLAILGAGGRSLHLMRSLTCLPTVRINAVCDVWDTHLQRALHIADPGAFTTKNYKDILARKDVDAVLVGSPDHWHVPMTIDALAAGKHVYVEKPLTHNLAEGKAILDAANKAPKLAVQVGTQQRSMTHIRKARELVKAGRLGKVHKVYLTWNRNSDRLRRNPLNIDPKSVDWKAFLGNRREQPFDEYRFRNWRWFWDFGGGIFTDLMVHWIDVAHWFLDLDHPTTAVALGQHTVSKDVWETPDTVQTILSYPGDVQAHFEGTFSNARRGAMIEFMGTDATLYVDRGRYELWPERNRGKPEEMILGTGDRGRDFYDKPDGETLHLQDWLAAIRDGKQPSAPVAAGVSAAAAAHLANKALRSGQTAHWA